MNMRNSFLLLALLFLAPALGAQAAGPQCGPNSTDPSCAKGPSVGGASPGSGGSAGITPASGNYGGTPTPPPDGSFAAQLSQWQSSSRLWDTDYPQTPWTPVYSGQTFTVLQLGFSTAPALGCGDFNPGDLVLNAKNEVEEIESYIKSYALQMALTYLLYSQPTIASAMQWLQTHVDKLEQLQLASCNQVAQLGRNSSDSAVAADALRDCMNAGHTATECSQSGVIKPYIDQERSFDSSVVGDATQSLASIGSAAYNSVAVTGYSGNGSSTCSGGGCNGGVGSGSGGGVSPAEMLPCLKSGGPDCGNRDILMAAITDPTVQKVVPQLLSNVVHNHITGQTTLVPRSGSVIALATSQRTQFMTMIAAFINATPAQIANQATSPLVPFHAYPGVMPPTPQMVAQLKVLRGTDPNTAAAAVAVQADADVKAYLNQIYGQIAIANSTMQASVPSVASQQEDRKQMNDQIAALRQEIDNYIAAQGAQDDQLKVQKQISQAVNQETTGG
jgi:hypothetical protein